jgi:hypothetical protein
VTALQEAFENAAKEMAKQPDWVKNLREDGSGTAVVSCKCAPAEPAGKGAKAEEK